MANINHESPLLESLKKNYIQVFSNFVPLWKWHLVIDSCNLITLNGLFSSIGILDSLCKMESNVPYSLNSAKKNLTPFQLGDVFHWFLLFKIKHLEHYFNLIGSIHSKSG